MVGILTRKEIGLAAMIAGMGFVFSARPWLLFLDRQTPIAGLLVYYGVVYVAFFLLSKVGLAVFGHAIKDPVQLLGLVLISFAFFITIDWESPYVQEVTGHAGDVSGIYFQAEDGAVWYAWQQAGILDTGRLRFLTYVLTPFLAAIVGGLLVKDGHLLGGVLGA